MDESVNIIEIERYSHCLIGRLALDYGFIVAKDLITALKEQHKEPGKKMGELLVEMGFATKNQINELIAFQKAMFKKVHQWNCLPDTLIKGFVYFGNQAFSFLSPEDIKNAEMLREERILQEDRHLLLHDIIEEIQGKTLVSQLKRIQSQVRLFYYECKQCHRLYRLFNTQKIDSCIYCPVCWDVPLSVFSLKNNIIPLDAPSQTTSKIHVTFESSQISQYYEILKKMEPLRRNEIVQHWTQDHESMTIKQVLGSLTRRIGEDSEVQIVDHDESKEHVTEEEVYVTRRLESEAMPQKIEEEPHVSMQTDSKSTEKIPIDNSQEQENIVEKKSTLKILAQKTKRILKGESQQSVFYRDMAQAWLALNKKMVLEDDIIYAFFVQSNTFAGETKKTLLEILKERGVLQEKQYQALIHVKNQEIPAQKPWNNKRDIEFCHYLFEKEVLPKEELQKIMLLQNNLYRLGIKRTYQDLLVLSKRLSKDIAQSLVRQFEKEIQEKKEALAHEEPKVQEQSNKNKAVFKVSVLQAKARSSYRLLYAILVLLVVLFLYKMNWKEKPSPKEQILAEKQEPAPNMPKIEPEPQKISIAPKETEIAKEKTLLSSEPKTAENKQTLVPITVDGMAMMAIHQILPKVPHLAETLQDNFQSFLKKPSFPMYENNHKKWQSMIQYHLKDKLISLDGNYQVKEIREKMEKLHALYENLDNLAKGLFAYVQEKKTDTVPKTFLEFLQVSKTTLYASESKNLLWELSSQKYKIFELK